MVKNCEGVDDHAAVVRTSSLEMGLIEVPDFLLYHCPQRCSKY